MAVTVPLALVKLWATVDRAFALPLAVTVATTVPRVTVTTCPAVRGVDLAPAREAYVAAPTAASATTMTLLTTTRRRFTRASLPGRVARSKGREARLRPRGGTRVGGSRQRGLSFPTSPAGLDGRGSSPC